MSYKSIKHIFWMNEMLVTQRFSCDLLNANIICVIGFIGTISVYSA